MKISKEKNLSRIKSKMKSFKFSSNNLGITLIALVITIIILLILAGVTISMTVGQNGILTHAESAVIEHGKGASREKLEITFGGAKIEKASNPAYNQDDYLDKIMTKEIKDIKILDNVVIVDGYAFEIDRSVPKVGKYIGKEEDLIIPNVTISEAELVNDDKQAKFTITAQEEKKGIKKIEVWLDGKKIDEHDENYSNVTTQITKECTVNKNGTYTVKVYGELTISKTVEVQGIVSSVSFEPNGDTTYKKAHTTKITIEGSTESIASIKYVWIKDDGVNEPTEDKFTETCPNDGVITGGNETMTGTYYLWVLLETITGKKNICASEPFYFDNEGPKIQFTCEPIEADSIKVSYEISDANSEFKIAHITIDGDQTTETQIKDKKNSITIKNIPMGKHHIKINALDICGNENSEENEGRTLMHGWDLYKTEITGYSYKFTTDWYYFSFTRLWQSDEAQLSLIEPEVIDGQIVFGSTSVASIGAMTKGGQYYQKKDVGTGNYLLRYDCRGPEGKTMQIDCYKRDYEKITNRVILPDLSGKPRVLGEDFEQYGYEKIIGEYGYKYVGLV